jgi:hypothetical protein
MKETFITKASSQTKQQCIQLAKNRLHSFQPFLKQEL